jgi:hypothetical protein
MLRIANDTPKEIIELLNMIDFEAIREWQLDNWYEQLKQLANQHLIRRTGTAIPMECDIPGCPQKVGVLISAYDFAKVPIWKRAIALKMAKNYLWKNVPIKNRD